jgi:hypothetical protein
MAKKPSFAQFEKSGADKDKGMKEGGKKDQAADKKQFKAFSKGTPSRAPAGAKRGKQK